MAIEYISYERFVNEISNDRKKETIIRYENNEYKFWYEKGKYCFKQCLPESESIKKFNMYEEVLNSVIIDNKTLNEIINSNDCEYLHKKTINTNKYALLINRNKEFVTYKLIIKPYLINKPLYSSVVLNAQKERVKKGYSDILINKNFFINLWYIYLLSIIILFVVILGLFCMFPIDGISITQTAFKTARVGLICSQLITFVLVGFFAPLLNDAPNKTSGYYKSNFLIYGLSLVSIIGVSINAGMNIGISEGIKTFCVFILGDIAALSVGYIIYKLYYKQKLKEAEKIREEYRKEQEGKLYK